MKLVSKAAHRTGFRDKHMYVTVITKPKITLPVFLLKAINIVLLTTL